MPPGEAPPLAAAGAGRPGGGAGGRGRRLGAGEAAGAPTTAETLRRQVLWSLTSGAAGEFVGSDDWEFHDGWERRRSTRALGQVARLRALFSALPWWRLVPDAGNQLVTVGRGTKLRTDGPMDVLENDYVTAARTPDGRLAVVYPPPPCPCRRPSPPRAATAAARTGCCS